MRKLGRGPAPKVLVENAVRWTDEFRVSGKPRPESRRYAHKDIRRSLGDMSCDKCFYCERLLKPREGGSDDEVEHRRGVHPHELAYDWKNLYLSCSGCNGAKKSRPEIAIEDTLDPCDDAIEPIDHLDVYVEHARPYRDSLKGEYTIKKLGLNSQIELLLARQRCLSQFWKARGDRMIAAARTGPVSEADAIAIERALAEEFAQPHMPFSWMFRAMLRRSGALSR